MSRPRGSKATVRQSFVQSQLAITKACENEEPKKARGIAIRHKGRTSQLAEACQHSPRQAPRAQQHHTLLTELP